MAHPAARDSVVLGYADFYNGGAGEYWTNSAHIASLVPGSHLISPDAAGWIWAEVARVPIADPPVGIPDVCPEGGCVGPADAGGESYYFFQLSVAEVDLTLLALAAGVDLTDPLWEWPPDAPEEPDLGTFLLTTDLGLPGGTPKSIFQRGQRGR